MKNLIFCTIAAIIIAVLPKSVLSQCTGLTEGTTFTSVSGDITSTVTWSTDRYITSALNITSSGDLTIDAINVKVANDVLITVEDGGVLTIVNGSDIYGEPDGTGGFRIWQGILVEGGGLLEMDDSQIFYAEIAAWANNSELDQSTLLISNSCFENNEIGIYFGPRAVPEESNSIIESTEFHAPDLVDELDNQIGDYGVLVFLTDYVYGLQIGNDDEYNDESDNYFHDYGMGVRVFDSDVTIQNCLFQEISAISMDLDYPDSGPVTEFLNDSYGVCATADENISIPPYVLTIGNSASTDINNVFFDVGNCIYAEEYVNTEIHFNSFGSTADDDYVMLHVMNIRDEDYNCLHNVKKNEIEFYEGYGIKFTNIDDGTINIEENVLTNSNSDNAKPIGISVTGSAETDVLIEYNIVDHAQYGIGVMGIYTPEIYNNTVEIYSSVPYSDDANGIWVLNCENAQIAFNEITGNCPSTGGTCSNAIRGILIDESLDCDADKNVINDCSGGILLWNDIEDINLSCNEIHYCSKGVWFIDALIPTGAIQNPGTPGDPSDNGWYPTSTAERVRAQSTGPDCEIDGIIWYYLDDAGEPWADINSCVGAGGGVCPTFDDETGVYCDQTPRLGEEIDDFDWLAANYGQWASFVSENGIYSDINHYYKAWNFWDLLKNDAEMLEALEVDFLAAYELVENSNIPVFDMIRHKQGNADLSNAQILNGAILPENGIEEIWQEVNSIYYGSLDESGRYILKEEDTERLEEIALMSGGEGGFGVYQALKMLELWRSLDLEEDEKFGEFADADLLLYPNPAVNYIYFGEGLRANELYSFEIIGANGGFVKSSTELTSSKLIDVSTLPSGLYLVKITNTDQQVFSSKIVIFKPDN